jgi:hypothetical protein
MHRHNQVGTVISARHFHKSSQFFCLTRADAEMIINYPVDRIWEKCSCPDEHYIPSILSLCGKLDQSFRRDTTFADWRHKTISPVTFHKMSENDLKALRDSLSLFARKFGLDSDIANYI